MSERVYQLIMGPELNAMLWVGFFAYLLGFVRGYTGGYVIGFDCSLIFPNHPARDEYGEYRGCPRMDDEEIEDKRKRWA